MLLGSWRRPSRGMPEAVPEADAIRKCLIVSALTLLSCDGSLRGYDDQDTDDPNARGRHCRTRTGELCQSFPPRPHARGRTLRADGAASESILRRICGVDWDSGHSRLSTWSICV